MDKKTFMPSLNHSYICAQLMYQLFQNEKIQPLPELSLDIKKGLIPDISVFAKKDIQPDFFVDVSKIKERPILAIEVISSSQTVASMLEKAKQLLESGIKAVWTIEPYGRSIFVMDEKGKQLFHEKDIVQSGYIKIDFSKIFS